MAGAIVVGAGHAGVAAAAGLRQAGYDGPVTLVADHEGAPYQRPPLSKEHLADGEVVPLRPEAFYASKDIALRSDGPVTALDPAARTVTVATGEELGYDHLVLATGARTRPLDVPGADLGGVHELRSLEDARTLRDALAGARRVVVVGAGFIGLEVAAAAREGGAEVTVLEALDSAMARVLSPETAGHVIGLHEAAGTTVRFGTRVAALVGDDDAAVRAVGLDGGEELPADLVVIGVGVVPNTSPASEAGLAVGDGIEVDAHLRTSDERIWAVGDCASFPLPDGTRVRLESVQNATDQGRAVGAAICGTAEPYDVVPWFWTVQHGVRVQIAGLTAGHDAAVLRGDPATGSFSVLCFAGERLLGVETVAAPREHLAARALLAAGVAITHEQAADPGCDLEELAAQDG